MKPPCHRRIVLDAALAGLLAAGLFAGGALSKDVALQPRTELGAVPEFHPELGLVRLAARIFLYWAAAAKIQLLKALHSQ